MCVLSMVCLVLDVAAKLSLHEGDDKVSNSVVWVCFMYILSVVCFLKSMKAQRAQHLPHLL
jgi:hypothetical protein